MRIFSISSIFFLLLFFPFGSQAQISGSVSYGKAHRINDLGGPRTFKYTEYQIFKFELSRPKIVYWKGPIRFEYPVERIIGDRFYIKDKPWVLRVVERGKIIIWTWGNGNDTVFNDVRFNNLHELKGLSPLWTWEGVSSPDWLQILKDRK